LTGSRVDGLCGPIISGRREERPGAAISTALRPGTDRTKMGMAVQRVPPGLGGVCRCCSEDFGGPPGLARSAGSSAKYDGGGSSHFLSAKGVRSLGARGSGGGTALVVVSAPSRQRASRFFTIRTTARRPDPWLPNGWSESHGRSKDDVPPSQPDGSARDLAAKSCPQGASRLTSTSCGLISSVRKGRKHDSGSFGGLSRYLDWGDRWWNEAGC